MKPHVHDPVEVLVIGSGFAGSTMAAELAEAGFDVLTLEAGPERRLRDMVSSQIWAPPQMGRPSRRRGGRPCRRP